jgi:NAD(P)-dependent dehydrogenase (short-subunit alcohol dehydrogenase family)
LTKIISNIVNTHGRLDGLVLNAAVLEPLGRIADTQIPLDAWKAHFDINVFSLIAAIRPSIAALRASNGRVVFVSSGNSVGNALAFGPYNASKASMNSICRYSSFFLFIWFSDKAVIIELWLQRSPILLVWLSVLEWLTRQ